MTQFLEDLAEKPKVQRKLRNLFRRPVLFFRQKSCASCRLVLVTCSCEGEEEGKGRLTTPVTPRSCQLLVYPMSFSQGHVVICCTSVGSENQEKRKKSKSSEAEDEALLFFPGDD